MLEARSHRGLFALKYAIISDLHANIEALETVLKTIDEMAVDKTVCLGDVVGYNACPNECVDIIRAREIPTVCGNHDAVACGLEEAWGFNPIALAAAMWTREHLSAENLSWLKQLPDTETFEHFVTSHGSPADRDCYLFTWEDVLPHFSFLAEQGRSICFFGHTHCPGVFSKDGMFSVDEEEPFPLTEGESEGLKAYFINPGSVGQPRDGDPRASFGLLDTEANTFRLMRIEYPVKKAAERVISQGLPDFLAERLFLGR